MSEPIDISHVFDCNEWHVERNQSHPIICDENHRVMLMVFYESHHVREPNEFAERVLKAIKREFGVGGVSE